MASPNPPNPPNANAWPLLAFLRNLPYDILDPIFREVFESSPADVETFFKSISVDENLVRVAEHILSLITFVLTRETMKEWEAMDEKKVLRMRHLQVDLAVY